MVAREGTAEPVASKRKKSPGQVLEKVVGTDHDSEDLDLEHFNGELIDEPGERLATSLPESLTIHIDLPPAPTPDLPEDEAAVRIDDIAIAPSAMPGSLTGEIALGELRPARDEEPRRTPYRRTG